MLKGGETNEKDCFDDFIVGFDFGVGRVPLVASPRPSLWPPSTLRFKMRGLLNSQLSFSNFDKPNAGPEMTLLFLFLKVSINNR
jgi:hypothetical protein